MRIRKISESIGVAGKVIQNDGTPNEKDVYSSNAVNEKLEDYLPINGNAQTATKATQDGDGNNIVNTYCTQTNYTNLNTRVGDIQLIYAQTWTDERQSYTFSGFNLTDGIYSIYIDCCGKESAVLSLFLNGQQSISQGIIEGVDSIIISSSAGGKSRIGTIANGSSSWVEMTLIKRGRYARALSQCGNINKINHCYYETNLGSSIDITSLTLQTSGSAVMYGNGYIGIYKRMSF